MGRLVSAEGVRIDPKDLEAILSLKDKRSSTVGGVPQILGFLSYYRAYLPNFSSVAKPLYELLQVKGSSEATQGKPKRNKGAQMPSRDPVHWTDGHQRVLEQLIDTLSHPPVLAYSDFELPYILHADASAQGLDAVLYQ